MTANVSVCLLTYNRADRLRGTLDSLLAQTVDDFELIIGDDCSTDATKTICREYVQRNPGIRYIQNQHNLGMPGNLNMTLQAASGKYVMNLHDGDMYRSDLVEKCRSALEAYPTAGFVFNAYRTTDADGHPAVYRESYPPLIPGRQLGERLLSRWDSCVFGTVMARREVYERLGWFDPQFGNFSDVDMWLRIAREYDVAYVNEPLMDLMPRDPTRFYAFVHWRVLFWMMGIHTLNLRRYQSALPDVVRHLAGKYPQRRRRYLLYNLLLCVKHRRWDRMREGLAVWRDSDDATLRSIGRLFGRKADAPDWYEPKVYWGMTQLGTSSVGLS
ncbi:MAG: glycosyltransferase family 2 protein [Chloroflexota bacterium]